MRSRLPSSEDSGVFTISQTGVSVTVLASGSRGNCTVLSSPHTRLLIDCGISCAAVLRKLRAHGVDPGTVNGILVTHEHRDHIAGLRATAEHLNIPVYLTEAAHSAWQDCYREASGEPLSAEKVEFFTSGQDFRVGDIDVRPFPLPHDAADPVGFTFTTEGIRVGYATDLGYLPAGVREHLRDCDGLMLEADYDSPMLESSSLPAQVKERRKHQHLSNEAAAEFLAGDYDGQAEFIVLAHLSEQNRPALAQAAAESALKKRRNR